jgi:hypothetical protein
MDAITHAITGARPVPAWSRNRQSSARRCAGNVLIVIEDCWIGGMDVKISAGIEF